MFGLIVFCYGLLQWWFGGCLRFVALLADYVGLGAFRFGFWVLGFCSCSVVLGFARLCFGVLILWVVFVVLVDLVVDCVVVRLAGWCSLATFRFGCGRSFCVGSRNIEFCFGVMGLWIGDLVVVSAGLVAFRDLGFLILADFVVDTRF